MRVTVNRRVLLPELAAAARIAGNGKGIPVIASVRLRVAAAGALELASTDCDTSLETVCLVENRSEAGGVLVNAKKFLQLVQSLPDDSEIALTVDKSDWLSIESGAISFRLAGLPLDDFPIMPPGPDSASLELPAPVLRELLPRVDFAISQGNASHFLCGALFVMTPDSMALVTTDGHRMAYAMRKVDRMPRELCEESQILIPRPVVEELQRLLEGQDTVSFHSSSNHLTFSAGGRVLSSKKLEGAFPPAWRRVLEKQGTHVAALERESFLAAVRRVALLASGDNIKAIRLTLAAGTLTLEAESAVLGKAHESIPAEYPGPTAVIGLNATYVAQWLGVANTEKVTFDVSGPEDAAGFSPGALPIDTAYRCVVMPVRL